MITGEARRQTGKKPDFRVRKHDVTVEIALNKNAQGDECETGMGNEEIYPLELQISFMFLQPQDVESFVEM